MKHTLIQKSVALLLASLIVAGVWTVVSGQARAPGAEGVASRAPEVVLGTAFTYQGQLALDGGLVDGSCDFRFSLWDSAGGATGQVGSTVNRPGVDVVGGVFVIPTLDFGAAAFAGQARWLAIAVRCPTGAGTYSQLSPRQQLAPAPYSLYASQAGGAPWSGLSDVPAGFADGVDNNTTYTAGDGLILNARQFAVDFGGAGTETLAARADHNHWNQSWTGPDFGLTLNSNSNFSNSAALTAVSRPSSGTGVQGVVGPDGTSAGMLVPTAVSGINLGPAGGFGNRAYGVYGEATVPNGYGIFGYATYTGTTGIAMGTSGVGLYGEALAPSGIGVRGVGARYGVQGTGVTGVYANSSGANGNGIIAVANSGSLAYGVWGQSVSGYAGYFSGKVHVQGALTKASGAFLIDHPLDPANQYLSHSFVESPDMKNIYDGVVLLDDNGQATVTLPDWFEALNQEFRYQLTCIGGYAPVYIAQEISNGSFQIAGGVPGLKVSWQVTGIRHDPWANDNRIQVEIPKPPEEIGTYLYPEGYQLPPSYGLNYEREGAVPPTGTQESRVGHLTDQSRWTGALDGAQDLPDYALPGGSEGEE